MSVSPTPSVRQRGRPCVPETPAEQIEGEAYGVSLQCVYGRPLWQLVDQHDAAHDRCLDAALARALELGDGPLIASIRDAQRFDALEDAAVGQLRGLWAAIHDGARRIAGLIETIATGKGRQA